MASLVSDYPKASCNCYGYLGFSELGCFGCFDPMVRSFSRVLKLNIKNKKKVWGGK
jgi:hypothetical protein